ncbi:MAG: haloacid dehalogenase-like hydrolase [Myxococcales bacterium]|nr:MAG: haloacid dehalogenase-like hydrolase [Myxococcales bacterium]
MSTAEESKRAALFCRVEGTLSRVPTLLAPAWCAANAQRLRQRALRLGQIVASLPFALGGDSDVYDLGRRLGWAALRGLSQDRIRAMAHSYAEQIIEPRLNAEALAHLQEVRRRVSHVVLISDSISEVMQSVAERVKADALLCNCLEYREGKATGRLLDPVIRRAVSGKRLRQYAAENNIDLAASFAVASGSQDSLMLDLMGHASVIHPDRKLRHLAKQSDWSVL